MKSDRVAELAAIKLRGLVAELIDRDLPAATAFGAGASMIIDGVGWVYVPNARRGTLGAAVAWGSRHELAALNVVFDDNASMYEYAAGGYTTPRPKIWRARGRALLDVAPSAPVVTPASPCPDLLTLLHQASLDVVADHGVWLGEINGLEVARVGERDGACAIDVGVGALDQFASAAIGHGDIAARLAAVSALVRPHRVAGAKPHPVGRLVRSRWLRAQAIRAPSLIGLDSLAPIPLLVPRPGLSESQPAAAIGKRGDRRVLVIFTVGVDLGASETAAELSVYTEPDEVLVVVPDRDRHPRIVEAVGRVAPPSSMLSLEGEWSDRA